MLATFLLVRSGETVETQFDLALPPTVVRPVDYGGYEYRLTVQKQPGTRAVPLRLSLALPEGTVVAYSQPSPASEDAGKVEYQLTLYTDQDVVVFFR